MLTEDFFPPLDLKEANLEKNIQRSNVVLVGPRSYFFQIKGMKSKIAFGPFLVLGAIIAYRYSSQIIIWWNGMI